MGKYYTKKSFIILLALLIVVIIFAVPQKPIIDIGQSGYYTFYYVDDNEPKFMTCSYREARYAKFTLNNIKGESLQFEGARDDVDKLIARYNATVLFEEYIDDTYTVYAYSSKIKGGVYVSGIKVNLQIAYTMGSVTIGSPIIYYSF